MLIEIAFFNDGTINTICAVYITIKLGVIFKQGYILDDCYKSSMHHAVHKTHSAGGGEEFVRIPSLSTFSGSSHAHRYLSTLSYHTRVCIPARCFTKCTHCTGFNHPPEGEPVLSAGSAAPRQRRCMLYEAWKKERQKLAVPKLASNRLSFLNRRYRSPYPSLPLY